MASQNVTRRRITISLPRELFDFANQQASRHQTSRSGYIASTLSQLKDQEEERLAAEGYRHYAREAREFAGESSGAAAEALSGDG